MTVFYMEKDGSIGKEVNSGLLQIFMCRKWIDGDNEREVYFYEKGYWSIYDKNERDNFRPIWKIEDRAKIPKILKMKELVGAL